MEDRWFGLGDRGRYHAKAMSKDTNDPEPTSERIPLWVYLLLAAVTVLIVSVTYYKTGSILACVGAVVCEFIVAAVSSLNVFFSNDSA